MSLLEQTAKVPNGQRLLEHGWQLAGFGIHRDSDPLAESNYSVAMRELARLAGVDPVNIDWVGAPWRTGREFDPADDCPIAVARFGHWAVGWVQELVVRVDRPDLVELATQLSEYVAEQYPVLDDHHYIELEWQRNHPDDGECYSEDPDCPCKGES